MHFVEITKYYRGMDVGTIWKCARGREAALAVKLGYGKLIEDPDGAAEAKPAPALAAPEANAPDAGEVKNLSWDELKAEAKAKGLGIFGKKREELEAALSEEE